MTGTTETALLDIEAFGSKYMVSWTRDTVNGGGHIEITEACLPEPLPCEWIVNAATVPSWVCNTHMYDGTGEYPTKWDENTKGKHPTECPFAGNDLDCDTHDHETYDFTEIA